MRAADKLYLINGYYIEQYLEPGTPSLEERMNKLAKKKSEEGDEFRELGEENYDNIVSAERRVLSCSHDWRPVHKWLHKEYMHCLKCGAVRHQDGAIWFFVDNEPFKLTMEKS